MTIKEIIVAVMVGIIESAAVIFYLYQRGVLNPVKKTIQNSEKITLPSRSGDSEAEERDEKPETEEIADKDVTALPSKESKNRDRMATALVILLAFGCIIAISILTIVDVSNYTNYAKLVILGGIVFASAVTDLKLRIIPNFLIIVGLASRVILYIVEFFKHREIFTEIIKSDLIGFAIGFGILLIVAIVSKGSVGFGDVKLFGIIGLMSGATCTYSTLLGGLIFSTVVSVLLIVLKKKDKKDAIPFGPAIFVGYFMSIILSSY